jgi:hypothetical protein
VSSKRQTDAYGYIAWPCNGIHWLASQEGISADILHASYFVENEAYVFATTNGILVSQSPDGPFVSSGVQLSIADVEQVFATCDGAPGYVAVDRSANVMFTTDLQE